MRCCRRSLTIAFWLLAAFAFSACDGYIEEVRVQRDGTVEFAARATVVCTDELQRAIWDGDPCDIIDQAIRTGDIGELPFGYELDPDRVSLVGSGEADRRVVDATWSGTADELSTLLTSSGTIRVLDDQRTEVVFVANDTPLQAIAASTDPAVVEQRRLSRWDPPQFRINAPDLIVEHNGDDIQGRIVIWDLDDDVADEFRVVWTTEDPPRRWWWIILSSVLLMIVLIMMVLIEGPAQAKAKAASDRAASDRPNPA